MTTIVSNEVTLKIWCKPSKNRPTRIIIGELWIIHGVYMYCFAISIEQIQRLFPEGITVPNNRNRQSLWKQYDLKKNLRMVYVAIHILPYLRNFKQLDLQWRKRNFLNTMGYIRVGCWRPWFDGLYNGLDTLPDRERPFAALHTVD